MKYLSICSGIEAASVAFEPLGWRPLAFSEIEAFPRAVLKHHYPDTPCHGDFTLLKDEPWIVDADMLCGGTPCQSFSVAGNRQSLADDRGNLTFQFVLLADAIDHLRSTAGRDPAWILWENVPGVFSTKDNAFGAFLGGLAGNDQAIEPGPRPESGKSSAFWGWAKNKHVPKWPSAGVVDGPSRCVAWRTLDAQHFGLAQRRKRVFVLARGGAGRWAVADALLPIIQSSQWHPAPGRSKGEGVTGTVDESIVGCLQARDSKGVGSQYVNEGKVVPVVAHTLRGEGFDASEDGTGRGIPLVMATGQAGAEVVSDGELLPIIESSRWHPAPSRGTGEGVAATITSGAANGGPAHGARSGSAKEGNLIPEVTRPLTAAMGTKWNGNGDLESSLIPSVVGTLTANMVGCAGTPGYNETEHILPLLVRMREGKEGGGKGPLVSEDQRLTLATGNDQVLCFKTDQEPESHGDISPTLQQPSPSGGGQQHAVMTGMQVRRLTPVECERLQGFPDNYTRIPWRGKPAEECPDGPRYKALGNSWAVPCARWIGDSITWRGGTTGLRAHQYTGQWMSDHFYSPTPKAESLGC